MSPSKRNALWLSLWSPKLDLEVRKIIRASCPNKPLQDLQDAHCYALAKSLENIEKFDQSRDFKRWVAGIGIVYIKYKTKHDDLLYDVIHVDGFGRDEENTDDMLEYNGLSPVVFRVGKRHKFIKWISLKENAPKPVAPKSIFLYNLLSSLPKGKHPTRQLLPKIEVALGKRLNEWKTYEGFLNLYYV